MSKLIWILTPPWKFTGVHCEKFGSIVSILSFPTRLTIIYSSKYQWEYLEVQTIKYQKQGRIHSWDFERKIENYWVIIISLKILLLRRTLISPSRLYGMWMKLMNSGVWVHVFQWKNHNYVEIFCFGKKWVLGSCPYSFNSSIENSECSAITMNIWSGCCVPRKQ